MRSARTLNDAGVRIRGDLRDVSGYVPGASTDGAVKLSSNETSFPPLAGVSEAIARTAASIHRYPDNNATELREALAQHWSVSTDSVIVGCGSSLLCQELVQATCEPGDLVAFGWRSFEAYKLYARAAHANTLTVPNSGDGSLDLPALARAINESPITVGIVFLCTPNNPTGASITPAQLVLFLDSIPASIPVVVDEAYQEFAGSSTVPAVNLYLAGRHNVVMLRTFSKAYGLAGLRVGYAIGDSRILNAVHAIRSPFSITATAQAAALAALDAQDELGERLMLIRAERDRVRTALASVGISSWTSDANFLWLPLGEQSAEFVEHCRSHRVLVRSFAPDGVRVSISTPEENNQFLYAAECYSFRLDTATHTERTSNDSAK